MNKPKVLFLDIETSPLISYHWGLFDQNIALNQIKSEWHLLSWSAKWLGSKKVIYMDQRNKKDITNDKEILKGIWQLMDNADIIVTQNGVSFDIKKLNARFILNGLPPPSSFKNIDTKRIASRKFGFTSNKLEWLTSKLCKKYKKMKVKKFSGFTLWTECLKGNKAAWEQMKRYNIMDVLSLEELYKKLIPWDNSLNFSLYNDSSEHVCSCGSNRHKLNGFAYTSTGRFQRYVCLDCGKETRGRQNLLPKEKLKNLKVKS